MFIRFLIRFGSPWFLALSPLLKHRIAFVFILGLGAFLLSLPLVSCHTTDGGDVNVLNFQLDSAKVGKFDSVRIEIFNGKAPAPGDMTKPAQVKVFKMGPGVKSVKLELNGKVKKDFSVIVTGFNVDGSLYRKVHSYEGFTADDKLPGVLLISKFEVSPMTIVAGQTRSPNIMVLPAEAVEKRFTLISEDPSMVRVVGDSLQALKPGKTNVSIASLDLQVKANLLVNVIPIYVASLASDSFTLSIGETRLPTVAVLPADAANKKFSLSSDDSTLVQIVGDSLKGLKAGKVKITATSADSQATTKFTVNVVSVRTTGISSPSLNLDLGDSVVPLVKLLPTNASELGYSLKALDSNIVSTEGHSIKALKVGSVKVLMESKDGGATDTLFVTVRIVLKRFLAAKLAQEVGDRFIPELTFEPSGATDRKYSLASKDTSIVKVTGDSLIAQKIGSDSVTATSDDGGIKVTFEVVVSAKVYRVKGLVAKDIRCVPADTLGPDLTWDPVNATNQGYSLISLDTTKLVVVGNRLRGLAVGNVKVEVTTAEGSLKTTFAVAIENPSFKTDILPITSFKCAPCHAPPATLNWQDSSSLVHYGASALNRLSRPDSAVGKMPLPTSPNGTLKPRDLAVLLSWISRVVTPLISISASDTVVNLGDTVVPNLIFTPTTATNKTFTLTSNDTTVAAIRGESFVTSDTGNTKVSVTTEEGKLTAQVKVTVKTPEWTKNVLPIIKLKCAPCHTPGTTFNWQDSASLIADGAHALDRLVRLPGTVGHMPLVTTPDQELSAYQLKVLLAWLHSRVTPLLGITVPDDSIYLGTTKTPAIIWNPTTATNKSFFMISGNTSIVSVSGTEMLGSAIGTTTVQARAIDGDFTKSFSVKVIPIKVDSLNVHDSAEAILDTITPVATFFPANATNQNFKIYLLKASTIIKVLDSTKTVGLSLGKDTVEAISSDQSKKFRFAVTVGPVLPKTLTISDTNGVVPNYITPRLVWGPTTTTNKAYTLSISPADTAVAAIRSGQIYCKKVGTVNTVTATSNAVPSVSATFKFTVGPVSVTSFTILTTTSTIGQTLTPSLNWVPTNATNLMYSLGLSVGDTAKFSITGAGKTLLTNHLASSSISVTSLDSNKTRLWTVNVVRTPFNPVTGVNVNGILTAKCGVCHKYGSIYPNWQDSTTAVNASGKIVNRINLLATDPLHMPSGKPMLPADTLAILTTYFSQN